MYWHYLDIMYHVMPPPHKQRQPLPIEPRDDGRPAWESPASDYYNHIGEQYENKREAVMKYTNNDEAKTIAILDSITEESLSWIYRMWAEENEGSYFFVNLKREIKLDKREIYEEKRKKGTNGVMLT